ncbi:MAG: phosphotransferase family protein, partial [Candidatus Heimdallarchaeaceae archaeon]
MSLKKIIRKTTILMDDDHALEVMQELKKFKVISDNSELENYKQIQGGADTTMFEISFLNHSKKYIQRIYGRNASNETAESEYNVQKTLFENNVNVPETYLVKLTPNTREKPYFIMEKIEGTRLDLVFFKNPEKLEQLIEMLLLELYKIHTIDPKLFPQISSPDIQKNPFAPIEHTLFRRKYFFDKYPNELSELKPVIDWLENNKTKNPCKELVIIHGDYHSQNIMVQDDSELRILDWSNISIRDFREDLGFTTVGLCIGAKENLEYKIADSYEQISGTKVDNLGYFMILASIFNLIRFYSCANNHSITNETEDTVEFF